MLPILQYGASIWGVKEFENIERVQLRAIRYFLGVHNKVPIPGLHGDMGWQKLKFRNYICVLRFWNRLINMDDNRLTKKIFKWDYELCNKNWSEDVKHILSDVDYDNIFTDVAICDLEFLYSKISNLQEIAWKAAVDSKPKLRTYALFKENFCTEKYVLSMLSRKQRSLLAQLRLGVLPLRIETGRYRRLAVEQRICELCNLNVVEDELHFIFTCPLYGAIRPNLLRQVENSNVNFQTLSEIGKLKSMMQNNIFSLSKYIEAAWNIRTKHLFN